MGRLFTPVYRATATILVDTSARALAGVDAVGTTKTYFERSTDLATRAELARSRRVLAEAARKLGWMQDGAGPDPVKRLQGGLTVATRSGTSFITLSFEGTEREQVHVVANAVAQAFEEQSLLALTGASASAAVWLDGQLPELRAKVIDAERKRYEFQQRHNILTSNGDRDSASKRFARLTDDLSRIERERISLETQVTMIDKASPELADSFPFISGSTVLQSLDERRLKLESQRADLLSRFKSDHRDVQVLDAQLAQITEERKRERARLLNAERGRLQYVRLEEEKLRAALAEQEVAVMDLNRKRLELEALDREVAWAREVYEPLATRKSRLFLASGNETPPVKVWDKARMAGAPVRPRKMLIGLVAVVVGLVIGIQLSLLLDSADTTVRGPADLGAATGSRVAGAIPHMNMSEIRERALVCSLAPKSPAAEAFRALRTSIVFDGGGEVPRSILVTGSVENEGKTLVSLNLAVAFAQMDRKILIVDADLRRSGVHKALGMENGLGLSGVLAGRGEPESAVSETDIPGLSVMVAGDPPENPAELLHLPALRETFDWASKTYDLVIVDSPPLTSVTDASLIARHVEGVILVARSCRTRRGIVERSVRILEETKARVIGAVLNDVPRDSRSYGYGYGYGYSYPRRSSAAKSG